MKLPKTLLGAIVVGIAAQAAVSCTEKKVPTTPKAPVTKVEKEPVPVPVPVPDSCPACGMG